jgi:hypothetical protein
LIYITVYNRFPNLLVFVSCVDYFQWSKCRWHLWL